MLQLIISLISFGARLLAIITRNHQRNQLRNEIENEHQAKQFETSRRAAEVRRAQRDFDRNNPDKRMQDDGYRRD